MADRQECGPVPLPKVNRDLAEQVRGHPVSLAESVAVFEWPGGSFDAARRVLVNDEGHFVHLTPKESDCLLVLAMANGSVVPLAELSTLVWCHESLAMTGTYQHAIRSLRTKVLLSSLQVSVESVRGCGYRLAIR
jgi:DNA-binding response OmpR family regulator